MLSFGGCSGPFINSQGVLALIQCSSDRSGQALARPYICLCIVLMASVGGFISFHSILMFLLGSILRESKPLSQRNTGKVMKGYWSRSGRVSWDPTGLWAPATDDRNVPKRFLQRLLAFLYCVFRTVLGRTIWLCPIQTQMISRNLHSTAIGITSESPHWSVQVQYGQS